MRIAVVSFTGRGAETARRAASFFPDAEIRTFEFQNRTQTPSDFLKESFSACDAVLFVSAAGIAVRLCAPLLQDKTQDPAVLVLDEAASFVIPILSGHIGGANRLARELAEKMGAQAVITTATDLNGRFAVDLFAKENGLAISSMRLAKEMSAAVLRGEQIGFSSELPVEGPVPEELAAGERRKRNLVIAEQQKRNENRETEGEVLVLLPRDVTLGIGCRRNTDPALLEETVLRFLKESGIDPLRICRISSISVKQEEEALRLFSEARRVPFAVYSAGHLAEAERLLEKAHVFPESDFVRKTVGVGNVCERAAVCGAAGEGKAKLIMEKRAENGITCAAAIPAVRFPVCFRQEENT